MSVLCEEYGSLWYEPEPDVQNEILQHLLGERVGCFLLATNTEQAAVKTQSMLEMLQRSEVSNPPAYGAKIANTILSTTTLRQAWYDDLITMSDRIRSMRKALYDELVSTGKSPGIK